MMILGIDPGAGGALAFIDTEHWLLALYDMPHFTEVVNGKNRKRVDIDRLVQIIREHQPVKKISTERVHAMPQMDVKSIFTFGRFYGQLEMLAAAEGIEFKDTDPAVWKRKMGVNSDKDLSRHRASQLVPAAASLLTRKTDHDRAEAIMLALYEVFNSGLMPGNITLWENLGAAATKSKTRKQ